MAEPVVLLHGVGLDATIWDDVCQELPRPSVAPDLPGHGTQPALEGSPNLSEFTRLLQPRLPEGPFHLVGFSLGGLVAQYLAATVPERVLSLSCVSAVCDRTDAEAEAVEARLASAREDFASTVQRSLQRWYEGTGVPEETVERTRAVLEANDPTSFVAAYEVFARGDREVYPELSRITAPTLAVTGELDPGSTPEMSRRIAAAVPGGIAKVIPGAKHMLPTQVPQLLARELETFMDQVERSAR